MLNFKISCNFSQFLLIVKCQINNSFDVYSLKTAATNTNQKLSRATGSNLLDKKKTSHENKFVHSVTENKQTKIISNRFREN